MKNSASKKAGYFSSTGRTFARFDNSGMHVDLDAYLRTDEGKRSFRSLAKSAFKHSSNAKTDTSTKR